MSNRATKDGIKPNQVYPRSVSMELLCAVVFLFSVVPSSSSLTACSCLRILNLLCGAFTNNGLGCGILMSVTAGYLSFIDASAFCAFLPPRTMILKRGKSGKRRRRHWLPCLISSPLAGRILLVSRSSLRRLHHFHVVMVNLHELRRILD